MGTAVEEKAVSRATASRGWLSAAEGSGEDAAEEPPESAGEGAEAGRCPQPAAQKNQKDQDERETARFPALLHVRGQTVLHKNTS